MPDPVPHAELPHRAAQVDHQEFEGLEDPGRSAFDADYQPALVVDREAGGRVDAERRVEFVVKAPVRFDGRFPSVPPADNRRWFRLL